jgi:hypothetical protein
LKYKVQGVSFIISLERWLSRDVSADAGLLLDKAATPSEKITGEIQYRGADKSLARPGEIQYRGADKSLARPGEIQYRGADKSLARPGRKKATATEDFDVHISYL